MSTTQDTPVVQAPVPAPVFVSMTETEKLIEKHKKISVEDMPKTYRAVGGKSPKIPGRTYKITYPGGYTREFPMTIGMVNKRAFRYRWFTEDRLRTDPRCSGYVMVRDDNAGGFCVDTKEPIPSHYFDNHVIRIKGQFLCFCDINYSNEEEKHIENLAGQRADNFRPGAKLRGNQDFGDAEADNGVGDGEATIYDPADDDDSGKTLRKLKTNRRGN